MSYSDREVWLPAIVITSAPDGRPTAETGALSAFAFVDLCYTLIPREPNTEPCASATDSLSKETIGIRCLIMGVIPFLIPEHQQV